MKEQQKGMAVDAIDDTNLPPIYVNNTDTGSKDEPDWDIPTGEDASLGYAIEDIRQGKTGAPIARNWV
ncbi:hypothetical protein C5167_050839 [Papaver somniferum]|uniref:Uncharacterized protein n=1 Tax=Papaver somniferum TaxID=3469 RepID=A0A4Y7KPR7_PAPSO|nr:hypothetical protein C5167_050839 [Papaver somniferum]